MINGNEIIESYYECRYKAYLKMQQVQGQKSNYERWYSLDKERIRSEYFNKVLKRTESLAVTQIEKAIRLQHDVIFNIAVEFDGFKFHCDFLKKGSSKSKLDGCLYIPVLIIRTESIPRKTKVLIAGVADILFKIQGTSHPYFEIVYGQKFRSSKIKAEPYLSEFYHTISLCKNSDQFLFHLNNHCLICEYSDTCRQKAIKDDHLSLLRGITRERTKQLNNRGIFSVNQLSYTFRPKRKVSNKKNRNKVRSLALQALAIREQKIFVYDMPTSLPKPKTEIYLDIEGIPDEDYYYLIGLTIRDDHGIKHFNYWADNPSQQSLITQEFISEIIKNYDDFVVYHYGTYEAVFLKKMMSRIPSARDEINNVLKNCYNILSVLYNNIYFPTYSNSLKDIGEFIGFKWSTPLANGIESIIWRKTWENSADNLIKDRLITYNEDDCKALIKLKDVIYAIVENKLEVRLVKDVQKEQTFTFLADKCAIPEMKLINNCSYFDYQREKVHTKTDKSKKIAFPSRKKQRKFIYDFTPNRTLTYKCQVCPVCQSQRILASKGLSKKVVNLNFSKVGIRVVITRYISYSYRCIICTHIFIPAEYPSSRLKLGHHLIVWVIYQHLVNKLGFRQIENNFEELFHLYISRATFFACKDYFIRFYAVVYDNLLTTLLKSSVLYVDETPFSMQFEKGYVWVFTNGSEVISIYKSSRESGFLKEYLKDFDGVLVTDFYNGYDALPCAQQKCLIHLIRDFNSDLIRNPFNEEFKKIAKDFTLLLQKIVNTIDRFGFRQYHLNKHIKEVEKFFEKTFSTIYQTEISQQYQNRLKKNRSTLFTFLHYDNVSWNNSNAEHAIKILALHTNKNINAFRQSRIDDYLKIMSVYQTCEYKNISFLRFLLSEKTIIDDFSKQAKRTAINKQQLPP